MAAHVTDEIDTDAPLREAPLPVAAFEAVPVPAADDGLQQARPLGAAAHPVNELIRGNAVGLEDFHGEVQVNWIGQHSQGLFGELGESCPAQHVNYILPSTLHHASRPSLT
jgi:hypothetical protein